MKDDFSRPGRRLFDNAEVDRMRARFWWQGMSLRALADLHRCSPGTVMAVVKGDSYADVPFDWGRARRSGRATL